MWIEMTKKHSVKEIEDAIINGHYNVWDSKRIKGAFRGGRGTEKDFKCYMNDNRKYATFIEIHEVFQGV